MQSSGLLHHLRQRPVGRLAAKIFRLWRTTGLAGLRWRWRLLRAQTQGYARWLREQGAHTAAERTALVAEIATLRPAPLISVIMPVCDPPEPWLHRAIESVRAQLYPHWQLCIADDASRAPHVRRLLESAAAEDRRIRVSFRAARGHICAATRTALDLAEGGFVTFLDHDDELELLALARIAVEIWRHPAADMLYGDEDLIGTDGRRSDPYFKPDWNPELLRAQNYICHSVVYRADLLRTLDAFRPEVQGSQDWDLALRAGERAACIRHIPHILYHWRTVPGSTAHADTAKAYAPEAGRRAVQSHLDRCGGQATAALLPFGHLSVQHALPVPAPRVSLIVTTPEACEPLLERTGYPETEVLPVAGKGAELLLQINRVAAQARGDLLCLVDGRCRPRDADWLATLAAEAARSGIGAVGARLLDEDGRILHAGYLLDPEAIVLSPYRGAPAAFPGIRNRALLQQHVSAVSGACLVVKRGAFERAGGSDPASGSFFAVDLCLRLLDIGLRNVWTPHATLVLPTPDTTAPETSALRYMQTRWRERLAHDPAGNPCIALVHGLPVPGTMPP